MMVNLPCLRSSMHIFDTDLSSFDITKNPRNIRSHSNVSLETSLAVL